MTALFILIDTVLTLYIWAIIIHVVMTWLVHFNVINSRSPFVYAVGNFLYKVTDPFLRPIRGFMGRLFGDLGGVDISPIIGILLLIFLRNLIMIDLRMALL